MAAEQRSEGDEWPHQACDVMAFGRQTGRVLSDGTIVGRAEPFTKVFPSSRAVKRQVGLVAWAILEDIALDARLDDSGRLVADTNVRRIADNLDLSKNTVSKHLGRLREAGFTLREEARAESGRWGAGPGMCWTPRRAWSGSPPPPPGTATSPTRPIAVPAGRIRQIGPTMPNPTVPARVPILGTRWTAPCPNPRDTVIWDTHKSMHKNMFVGKNNSSSTTPSPVNATTVMGCSTGCLLPGSMPVIAAELTRRWVAVHDSGDLPDGDPVADLLDTDPSEDVGGLPDPPAPAGEVPPLQERIAGVLDHLDSAEFTVDGYDF